MVKENKMDISIDDIIKVAKKKNNKIDEKIIIETYEFSREAHQDEMRATGEPYITHPMKVALIVAEMGLQEASICAALLHDVVEDTGRKLSEIQKKFGKEVATLVDGVTKISEIKPKSREYSEAENIRKILLATCSDIRNMLIKLADKLHNMRTLYGLAPKRQIEIAQETLDIYAPIAYRLGLEKIKNELQDLSLMHIEPEIYKEISEKIKLKKGERDTEVEKFKEELKEKLKENNISAKIKGRAKHIYSIYKKMERKNRLFEEIYDVIALRIITKNVKECYDTLGIVHNMWTPIPGHIKDYIAMPKLNMYQSLHTIVMVGRTKKIIEIQIRTEEMNKIAEEGVAAHWAYKGIKHSDDKFDKKLSWLKQIQDWQHEEKDAKNFIDSLRIDLFQDEIYCFTPRGDVIDLPTGSTVIDFAYAIHTSIGDNCAGATVNGTFASLRTQLKTGDVVKIVTNKAQHPARGWLKVAKTQKAKNKIRKYLQDKKQIPIGIAKEKKTALPSDIRHIIEIKEVKKPKQIRLAKCCTPLPGDPCTGFATRNDIVTIHKIDCKNIEKIGMGAKKKVTVNWLRDVSSKIQLKIDANDRVGFFADVLNTISATGTNMNSAHAKVVDKERAQLTFELEIDDLEHLKDIISRIKKIQSVKRVYVGRLGM